MKNSSLLLEEALLVERFNTLITLTEEDIKSLDKDLSAEDLSALTESFREDPELLVEFLGTIAGLGGKAAKYLGSKFGSAKKTFDRYGKSLSKYSALQADKSKAKADAKQGEKDKISTRKAHTAAVKAYGKSLKGKDPKAKAAALKAMKDARYTSMLTRGRAPKPGAKNKDVHGQKIPAKMRPKGKKFDRERMYKRLGEALVELYLESLNEDSEVKKKVTEESDRDKRFHASYDELSGKHGKATANKFFKDELQSRQSKFEKSMLTNKMGRINKVRAPKNKVSSTSDEERFEAKVAQGVDRDELASRAHMQREKARQKDWERENSKKGK